MTHARKAAIEASGAESTAYIGWYDKNLGKQSRVDAVTIPCRGPSGRDRQKLHHMWRYAGDCHAGSFKSLILAPRRLRSDVHRVRVDFDDGESGPPIVRGGAIVDDDGVNLPTSGLI